MNVKQVANRAPCLAYSSTQKMEAIYFSESSFDFQLTTWRYIPEDRIFFKFNFVCTMLKPLE
jgi:hypothetical protein